MRCGCNRQKPYSAAVDGAPREQRKRIAGVDVTLSWPSTCIKTDHDHDASASSSSPSSASPIKGITFLLPGAMIGISEYNGLRDVILDQQHLVVSLYVNVLWPIRNNHRKHARDVKNIFNALRLMYPNKLNLPKDVYSVVGHSAGGKIALLLASIVDPKRVSAVLALDPVDIAPTEFSNEKGTNLPLGDGDDIVYSDCDDDDEHNDVVHVKLREHHDRVSSKKDGENEDEANNNGMHIPLPNIPIILTCTEGGRGIPPSHNANAIHEYHPNTTTCYHHAHAGHMAYCDHGGGTWAGHLMPDVGRKEGNEGARMAAKDLIRQMLTTT